MNKTANRLLKIKLNSKSLVVGVYKLYIDLKKSCQRALYMSKKYTWLIVYKKVNKRFR